MLKGFFDFSSPTTIKHNQVPLTNPLTDSANATADFHSWFLRISCEFPTTTNPSRALENATFILRLSLRKPREFFSLDLTLEKMISS